MGRRRQPVWASADDRDVDDVRRHGYFAESFASTTSTHRPPERPIGQDRQTPAELPSSTRVMSTEHGEKLCALSGRRQASRSAARVRSHLD